MRAHYRHLRTLFKSFKIRARNEASLKINKNIYAYWADIRMPNFAFISLKTLRLIFLLCIFSLVFTSQGRAQEVQKKLQYLAQSHLEKNNPEAEGKNLQKSTRKIIDMVGRELEIPLSVNKIGTLGSVPMINTFVESLGAGYMIMNRPSLFHDINGRWRMHKVFAPQIINGPSFQSANHEILLENIIDAKPDLCVTMTRSIADALEKIGVPCVVVRWNSIESMKESVSFLGDVLGKKKEAKAYLEYFSAQWEELASLGELVPEKDRKSVLYSNPLLARCPGELSEAWLKNIGARSVTAPYCIDGKKAYELEDVLEWNPEVIIVTSPSNKRDIEEDRRYQDLRAIKNKALLTAPTVGHMWGGHTVEAPLAATWMMHKIYPELMPKDVLEKKIFTFYRDFFKTELKAEEINAIIKGTVHDKI